MKQRKITLAKISTLELMKASLINNPNATDIDPAMIARLSGAIDNQQWDSAWFGPMSPLAPMAPPSTAGRMFDYPVGYNTRIGPRSDEGVSFYEMRHLADKYSILRLAIETRKDQLAKLPWLIRKKADLTNAGSGKKQAKGDPAVIQKLTDFWSMPDQENSWDQWLRMIVEDMLVIDAVTIFPMPTKGGGLYGLDLVDGGTIKRVIDDRGRTPMPPYVAYQQILKGVPANNFTRDELIYYPRNKRTNRIYGFSPVEQVILITNIGLRRDISQLQYYTEGNIPEAFAYLPDTWTPQQIADFQKYWDSILEGNTAERRHMKFLPGGSGARVDQVRDPKLKDEYDEWLARIICYCFSLPPTPFIKQMNRAVSESMQEAALEEGLHPMMQWVTNLCNYIHVKYLGISGYEFAWGVEEDMDKAEQEGIITNKIKTAQMTINEGREMDGLDPDPNGNVLLIYTSTGAVRLEDAIKEPEPVPAPLATPGAQAEEPKPGEVTPPVKEAAPVKEVAPVKTQKIQKAKGKIFRPLAANRLSMMKGTRKIKKVATKFFRNAATDMADQIHKRIEKLKKSENDQIGEVLNALEFKGWDVLVNPTQEELEAIYREAALHAMENLKSLDIDISVDKINEAAAEWAKARAAEMVGMKWVDGELQENPQAEWTITESTRDMLRTTVTNEIEQGSSLQDLNDAISKTGIFDEDRAELIARTELKNADSAGNFLTYLDSGMNLEKSWLVSNDHDDKDECDDNEEDGWIPLSEPFSSGDLTTGAHPRCNCSIAVRPVGSGEEE